MKDESLRETLAQEAHGEHVEHWTVTSEDRKQSDDVRAMYKYHVPLLSRLRKLTCTPW